MLPTSKWEVHVEKRVYVVTGEEAKVILANGNARFVVLKKLVINPAFIQDMVEIESGEQKPAQLEEPPMSEEKRQKNIERIEKARKQFAERKYGANL